MEWTETKIYTSSEGIDILCANLMDIGIKGFAVQDAESFNEFLENKEGKWDYIDEDLLGLSSCESCVTVYIPKNAQGAEMLTALKSMLAGMKENDSQNIFGRLDIECSGIREEDWANNWKQYFKPLNIGRKLIIKPSWENCENPENRIILEIDPASSFGTGQHHTTRLCLELLEKSITEGDKILDIGCGSGILSIGAMLLGADNAVAVDIEENAVNTAVENALKNHISTDKYHAYCGNIISDSDLADKIDGIYDIITANIVADVLIAMKNLFARYLRNNGTLIISGIIEERMKEVTDAVESAGFTVQEYNIKDGWAAVRLIKK